MAVRSFSSIRDGNSGAAENPVPQPFAAVLSFSSHQSLIFLAFQPHLHNSSFFQFTAAHLLVHLHFQPCHSISQFGAHGARTFDLRSLLISRSLTFAVVQPHHHRRHHAARLQGLGFAAHADRSSSSAWRLPPMQVTPDQLEALLHLN